MRPQLTTPGGDPAARPVVLIVDADDLLRWALREVLSDANFSVCDVGTAAAALETVGQRGVLPAVALVDPSLPDASGVKALRALKGLVPSCRVIAMTAGGTAHDYIDRLRDEADDVLDKPIDLDVVVRRVQQCVS